MPSSAVAVAAAARSYAMPWAFLERNRAALAGGGNRESVLRVASCDPTDAWRPPAIPSSPARRLVAAVFWQALFDFALGPTRAGKTRRRDVAEAARWLASNDVAWPFSFLNCCGVLGLEPGAVRTMLRRDGGATVRRIVVDGRRGRT